MTNADRKDLKRIAVHFLLALVLFGLGGAIEGAAGTFLRLVGVVGVVWIGVMLVFTGPDALGKDNPEDVKNED